MANLGSLAGMAYAVSRQRGVGPVTTKELTAFLENHGMHMPDEFARAFAAALLKDVKAKLSGPEGDE